MFAETCARVRDPEVILLLKWNQALSDDNGGATPPSPGDGEYQALWNILKLVNAAAGNTCS